MSDVLFGKTEVDAVSAEIVLGNAVQQYLIQEAKLLPTVSDYSAFAAPGMDKLKIPTATGFTVDDKSENTAVSAQTITYSTDDLALDKHKVIQVLAEQYASLQSGVNVVQDIALRAGKALALQLDVDIIAALIATSASNPDHRVAYAAGSALTEADITNARLLLNNQYVPLEDRYLLIPTADEKAALAIANFIQQDRYAGNMAIMNGEIGMAYGFKVIVHASVTYPVAYHKSHVGVAVQQGLRYQTQPDLANLATRHSFDQVYGVKTLDSGKRGVKIGSAS